MEKETGELLKILKNSSDLSGYMEAASDNIRKKPVPLSDYLADMLEKKKLEKKNVIRDAGLERKYGYEIFRGSQKKPSKDKVLALCFAMHLTCDETQELLKKTDYPLLYPKIERDSAILFGLINGWSLDKMNDFLYEKGYPVIESSDNI